MAKQNDNYKLYLDRYKVFPSGNVVDTFRKHDGQFIFPLKDTYGNLRVPMAYKGDVVTDRLDKIVAYLFLDNPDNLTMLKHKDKDKENCSVDNLEFFTNKKFNSSQYLLEDKHRVDHAKEFNE